MTRMAIVGGMMTAGLLMVSPDAAAAPGLAEQSTPRVTAAEAAPFIGEWTLNFQGDNGPATLDLAVTAEKDTVAGRIAGPAGAAQPISDVTKVEKSLVLSYYSFDYEGTPVDAVVRLTPADKGEMNAEKLEANRHNLPASIQDVRIEGGNHSQFGFYGFQPGDWPATISRAEQQRLTVQGVLATLDQLVERRIW